MNNKETYHKWVGVLLSIILNGSAHFLSGKRSAGMKWYFGLFACGLMGIILISMPGTVAYALGATFGFASIALWCVMIKQSYRPVKRIGFLGWLAVIVLALILNNGASYLMRQFISTYKMPTGSMQPTIFGVHSNPTSKPGVVQQIISGQKYIEIKAENSGTLSRPNFSTLSSPWTYTIDSHSYELPRFAIPFKVLGEHISIGETLWAGIITSGDRLFVEQLSYRFRDPKRGDIVVFKTEGIEGIQSGAFYMKRIAGLPGERIRIEPPYLIVNDQKVMEPEIFNIISSKSYGYSGFLLAHNGPKIKSKLTTTNDCVTLGENEYFVTDDNSPNSLDCRYFEPVPRDNIIGKVTRIYYPLARINKLR